MSRVVVTEISPGDDVDVGDPNTTILLWNAQTQTIDGDNIRDGGIHQRNLAAEVATPDISSSDVYQSSNATNFNQSSWAVITMTTDGDVEIGPFDIDTSLEEVIVWVTLEYYLNDTSTEDVLEFQLAYSIDNGSSWTSIGNSQRQVSAGFNLIKMHGSLGIAHRVTTSIDATQTLWRLEAQETNNTQFTIDGVNMFIIRRKL